MPGSALEQALVAATPQPMAFEGFSGIVEMRGARRRIPRRHHAANNEAGVLPHSQDRIAPLRSRQSSPDIVWRLQLNPSLSGRNQ